MEQPRKSEPQSHYKRSYDKSQEQEFFLGMKEELEHSDAGDPDIWGTRKTVLEHLEEDPSYYSKLREATPNGETKGNETTRREERWEILAGVGWKDKKTDTIYLDYPYYSLDYDPDNQV